MKTHFANLTWITTSALCLGLMAACGRAPQYGQNNFDDSLPPSGEATVLVDVTSPKPHDDGLNIQDFTDPRAQVDLDQKRVLFSVVLKTQKGDEHIQLVGDIQVDSTATLIDSSLLAQGQHQLKAIALCIDGLRCREMSIDVYYRVDGRIRHKQFVTQQPASGPSEPPQPPPDLRHDPNDVHLEHAEEEFSEPGEYVGIAIKDRSFFDDLEDISVENKENDSQRGHSKTKPTPDARGNRPVDRKPLPDESAAEKKQAMLEEFRDHRGVIVLEKDEAGPQRPQRSEARPSEDAEADLDQQELPPQKVPTPRPKPEHSQFPTVEMDGEMSGVGETDTLFHGNTLIGLALNINRGAGQAVGLPYKDPVSKQPGSLIDASELPRYGEAHEKVNPSRDNQFGTGMMVKLIEDASVEFRTRHYPDNKIYISGISKEEGGVLFYYSNSEKKWKPHASHQSGQDIDIAYLSARGGFANIVRGGKVVSDFDFKRNFEFIKLLVQTQLTLLENTTGEYRKKPVVSSIYVNKVIKKAFCQWAKQNQRTSKDDIEVLRRLRGITYHKDHFHMRLRCSPDYPRCRNEREMPAGSGCKEYGVHI